MSDPAITSTTCAVCGGRVRVASGHLVKHRVDGHVCDNSGCEIGANERGRVLTVIHGCDDHTHGPGDYAGWHAWAEEKAKTHAQTKCPECGLYLIWEPNAASNSCRTEAQS